MATTKQAMFTRSKSMIDGRDVSCLNIMLYVPIEEFSDLEDKVNFEERGSDRYGQCWSERITLLSNNNKISKIVTIH